MPKKIDIFNLVLYNCIINLNLNNKFYKAGEYLMYKSNRIWACIIIVTVFTFIFVHSSFSASSEEITRLQQSLQIAYRNYVDASTLGGPNCAEAQKWFNDYQNLAKKYNELTGGSEQVSAPSDVASDAQGASSADSYKKPNIFNKIGYQFLERLKVLLNKVPSHVNDFALGEMNFVTGNYKDALTLYQMAQRKAELDGKYYYQSIYWQGRCYLEMAKTASTESERIALYKKAQERFLNVSMNLLLKNNRNQQEKMYEQDSTNLVIQIKRYVGSQNISIPNPPSNNNSDNGNNITSNLDDNSWQKELRYDYMISDKAYIDTNSMSRNQIQNFLSSKQSVLSRPVDGKYPADMIYEAAHKYGISPKVLLARLQTEQGLVTKKTATQKQLDWALGCGAYDGGNWNTKYQGLEKQIEYGAKTMRNHYNIGLSKLSNQESIPMKIDGETIKIKNAATYAQYMYTPHKHGGKLFRSIYISFF